MLSSPAPLSTQERAKHAELRLRAALQRVAAAAASQGPQQHGTATVIEAAEVPATSATSSVDVHADAPCAVTLEWPFPPLAQRAKEKRMRDGQRQRRRATRQAAAKAATTASLSAADVMRNTLSQPLGVMAARLLSAATAGAPSLFSERTASGHTETSTRNVTSPPPPHLAGASDTVAAAAANAHTPSSFGSPHTAQKGDSASLNADRRPRHSHAHRYRKRHGHASPQTSLLALNTTPLSPRPENGGGPAADAEWRRSSPGYKAPFSTNLTATAATADNNNNNNNTSLLTVRTEGSPTRPHLPRLRRPWHAHHHKHHNGNCRHASPSSKPVAVSSAAKADAPLSSSSRARGTPTSASSPTHSFFTNSPITLLARTFGSGGGGRPDSNGNPTLDSERTQKRPASMTRHATTLDAVNTAGAAPVTFASSVSSNGHHHGVTPPPVSSCSCSGSSDGGWYGSSSTLSGTSAADAVSSGSDPFLYPMTAPGPDGCYHPRAPQPSLLRRYGDAATRHLFDAASSTSTQHSASRSSTPFSSEWSAGTSSTNVDRTPPAAEVAREGRSSATPSAASDDAGGARVGKAVHPSSSKRPHHHHSSILSPNLSTQLSFATEMDAIERGQVAPYMSYLFAPEARVVDLRQLERQLRQRESSSSSSSPAVAATCVRFCHAGDAYLVGTSSGVLWRVPVGGGREAVRATPLGSLWPPPSETSKNGGGGGRSGGASLSATPAPPPASAAVATTTVPATVAAGSGALPSASTPVPLSGHTAAILSIAFNDDGSLYATTGLDGCVIVWKASTSAKLRRISAVWASTSTQRAPYLVRFMPQNNNYLLVSYVNSGELHLYNSSTGLPVTNVAGTGLSRMTINAGSSSSGSRSGASGVGSAAGSKSVKRSGVSNSSSRGGGAITSLAVSLIASPFFVSGDAEGTVVLWTYRAGDLVTWPTLSATSPPASGSGGGGGGSSNLVGGAAARHTRSQSSVVDPLGYSANSGHDDASSTGGGGGGGGAFFSTPLYQLPELRRVAACALPSQAGGVAAISMITLHAAQLHSLFRPCGSQCAATAAADPNVDAKSAGTAHAARPHHPLEATAQLFHTTAVQNRACREELEARQAEEEEAATTSAGDAASRSRRESHAKTTSTLRRDTSAAHASSGVHNNTSSSSSSSFPHVLAGLPSRLSDTFSALWGGSGNGGGGGSYGSTNTAAATTPARRPDTSKASSPAAPKNSSFNTASLTERELLKQLRSDAMDVVCPLLILVTAPCDTVYSLGLLLQLSHGSPLHGNSSSGGGGGGASSAAKPTVSYRLYPLLKTTGPSRMRHVGVGAVPSPDNHRLVVVAAPCEEGFVRVLPLLRLETAAATATITDAAGGAAKAGATEATRVNRKHVLATLPMPYGGRCTGIAWSPSGRYLVAIAAEGVIYEWSRVYLLSTTSSTSSGLPHGFLRHGAGLGKAAKRSNSGSGGGETGHTPPSTGVAGRVAGTIPAAAAATAAKAARKLPAEAGAADGALNAAAAEAAAMAAARRRGCGTEYSDTVQRPAVTRNFTSLLGTSMMAPAAAAAAMTIAGESDAARAAFREEDAWRESFQRELERQRREQAALKLVTHPGDDNDAEVSSSGYWLDDEAISDGSLDTLEEEEDTQLDNDASSN